MRSGTTEMGVCAPAPPRPTPTTGRVRPTIADRISSAGWPTVAVAVAVAVVTPVALLSVSVVDPDVETWQQQWDTRLPGQLVDTAVLLVGVSVGALVLGGGLAWLTSSCRFPGSQLFGWLLVAPLAMPSYVLGFVTLSVIGFTGPVQGWWRDTFGAGAWFPEVRSMGGAITVFSLVLYPYVYLLARAALADQAKGAFDVARSLGAGPVEAARRVVLPLLRPALAAGVAIVMMETLTDFATVQYFGVDTVTVGVFRIWRGTFDRDAAAELATLVLVVALMIIGLERVLRGRARFGESAGAAGGLQPQQLSGVRGVAASSVCVVVVAASFGAPTAQLAAWAVGETTGPRGTPLVGRFTEFLQHSLILAALTALVCVAVAIAVANGSRFTGGRTTGVAARLTAIGYAVPGPVVAIGVVLALVALDDGLGIVGLDLPGAVATGSLVGLVYAYCVRFTAPGLSAVEAGLAQVPEEVTASARTLGWRPRSVLTRVHLPLARTSIVTGAVLVAVDALKELPIALLLRPIGFDTLSIWTYNLATESRFEQAALPAIAIIAVALLPVGLLSRQLSRQAGHP